MPAKRRKKAKKEDEVLEPGGRQLCRFPAIWEIMDPHELTLAHEGAKQLRETGYGSIEL